MNQPTPAVVDAHAPAAATSAAAELAARIQIPRRLPSATTASPCATYPTPPTPVPALPGGLAPPLPQRRTNPPSGAMFLGSHVDDAITGRYRH
jgi:hypothetical protein